MSLKSQLLVGLQQRSLLLPLFVFNWKEVPCFSRYLVAMQWSLKWSHGVLMRCKLASHTHTHIHCVTSLLFVCVYCIRASMGYIHSVRLEGKKAVYLFSFSYTLTHTLTHTLTEISRRGALQWISVLTQVIAFLLGSLWVLIQLDKVCSSARDSQRFICTTLVPAPARTTSVACAALVLQLIGPRRAGLSSFGNRRKKRKRRPKLVDECERGVERTFLKPPNFIK